jgi:hypothetical protein
VQQQSEELTEEQFGWVLESALWFSKRGSVDANGVALVPEPAEQGVNESFVAEEAGPFVIVEV